MVAVILTKEKYEVALMEIEGVTGVGVSTKRNLIIVYVVDKSVIRFIPEKIEGFPVEVMITGPVRAL